MQDRETDSYWSIMTGDVIAGKLKGTRLKEIPVASKMQWKDWVKLHPNTLVLSVNGREDVPYNPYLDYFGSSEGYRGLKARDQRLESKASIFAFEWQGEKVAVPFQVFEGGHTFHIKGTEIFLYRPKKAAIFYSTRAFQSPNGFEERDGQWYEKNTGCRFNQEAGRFEGGEKLCNVKPLPGIDTFWYNWSLTNPNTHLLMH